MSRCLTWETRTAPGPRFVVAKGCVDVLVTTGKQELLEEGNTNTTPHHYVCEQKSVSRQRQGGVLSLQVERVGTYSAEVLLWPHASSLLYQDEDAPVAQDLLLPQRHPGSSTCYT